jgi:hypothetical protein
MLLWPSSIVSTFKDLKTPTLSLGQETSANSILCTVLASLSATLPLLLKITTTLTSLRKMKMRATLPAISQPKTFTTLLKSSSSVSSLKLWLELLLSNMPTTLTYLLFLRSSSIYSLTNLYLSLPRTRPRELMMIKTSRSEKVSSVNTTSNSVLCSNTLVRNSRPSRLSLLAVPLPCSV